jgi:hypothetical protein
MLVHWDFIKSKARAWPLVNESDVVTWNLSNKKVFSTKSMYQHLERNLAGSHNKWIWKAKIPLKMKIFLWQLFRNAILTRDNLKRRRWAGSPLCSFCNQCETARHLFFECANAKVVWGVLGKILGTEVCPMSLWQSITWLHCFYPHGKKFHMLLLATICWGIWNVRNKITFEGSVVRSPLVTIATICSFLHFWSGLYGVEEGEKIKKGVGTTSWCYGGCSRDLKAQDWLLDDH